MTGYLLLVEKEEERKSMCVMDRGVRNKKIVNRLRNNISINSILIMLCR